MQKEGQEPREYGLKIGSKLVFGVRIGSPESVKEKIDSRGEAEARALNMEYERLKADAESALRELSDFERDKLGMHQDTEE